MAGVQLVEDSTFARQWEAMDEQPRGLNDPKYAAYAWARYRRIMKWMALASAGLVTAAIVALDHWYGPLSWITVLAAIGGFGGTALLTSALVGLVFLSSGTGHDEDVENID
jgi:hypothetical protein